MNQIPAMQSLYGVLVRPMYASSYVIQLDSYDAALLLASRLRDKFNVCVVRASLTDWVPYVPGQINL